VSRAPDPTPAITDSGYRRAGLNSRRSRTGGVTAAGQARGMPSPLDLFVRLRGSDRPRPVVDPGLAGGLREWLEDSLAAPAGSIDHAAAPVRVTKDALSQVLVCEAHLVANRAAPRRPTFELITGTLVDVLFRQWVTAGKIDDPFEDALSALASAGDGEADDFLRALAGADRKRLEQEVVRQVGLFKAHWAMPPAGAWLPRTQDAIGVPICGGRIMLSGVVDLILGMPAKAHASTCVVEVKSGRRRLEHRADLHFYSLLETLRSGAPPFCAATYYAGRGDLDVEPVSEELLVASLERVITGTERLCRLAAGQPPVARPNPLCAWCEGLAGCEAGQRSTGTKVARNAAACDEPRRVVSSGRNSVREVAR